MLKIAQTYIHLRPYEIARAKARRLGRVADRTAYQSKRSPDGAQRNPGLVSGAANPGFRFAPCGLLAVRIAMSLPHFASLHAGYGLAKQHRGAGRLLVRER